VNGGPEITPTMTYGTGAGSNLTVSGNVTGEGTITIKIEAGSTLIQAVEQAKTALKLAGQVNSNGPGSTGKSSPDAAAPATRGSTGSGGGF
jgi:hypothetical protein